MSAVNPSWRHRIGTALAMAVASLAVFAVAFASSSNAKSSKPKTGSPIVIGASMEETGVEAIPSLPVGYKVAVAQVNAAGGIKIAGVFHKIDLIILDNRSDPTLMAQQVHTLVEQDHAVALVSGCCDLNVTEAPLANALKVPLMGTGIPIDLMTSVEGHWAYDAYVSLASGITDYFTKVISSLGTTDRKVALIADDNPQGQATNAAYAAVAQAAGYTVTASTLVPVGTTDYSSFIGTLKSTNTDNLVAQMTTPDCFALWKQMKSLGYQPKTATANQCGTIPTWTTLGKLGNGALLGLNWTPTSGLPNAEALSKWLSTATPACRSCSVRSGVRLPQVQPRSTTN
jgi:branched-chain amino acid transport system substrate-binding protein